MNLIFDVGMYVGDDTEYYLNKGFKVVAVEANPILVEKVKAKCQKQLSSGQLVIINKGISSKSGYFSFWVNKKNAEWSSFDKEAATKFNTPVQEIVVECIKINELFDKYGVPHFLKIDIEGVDKECLASLDFNKKPKYLSCEAGDPEILEILNKKGYTKFKMINQANGFYPFAP